MTRRVWERRASDSAGRAKIRPQQFAGMSSGSPRPEWKETVMKRWVRASSQAAMPPTSEVRAPGARAGGASAPLSPTSHLPLTYLSSISHLPILYQSSIIYRSSIYRSPIDHLSLPVPRLWRTMTSAELSRPEQEDEAGTASHVRVAPTAPPCAARHRCGRGGSFASPRRKRSAHLLRGSPFATNLDASPTHRNGGGSSAVPPPPRGCPGPAGGGGGRAWR